MLPLSWSAAAERWGRGLKLSKKELYGLLVV
jgi:hypothetical protein